MFEVIGSVMSPAFNTEETFLEGFIEILKCPLQNFLKSFLIGIVLVIGLFC